MEMSQKKIFAERLGKLRCHKNLSQQQLADETGINRETIARYETCKRNPTFEHLTSLAHYFESTTDFLLGLSTAETRNCDIQSACNVTGLSEAAVRKLAYTQEDIKSLLEDEACGEYEAEYDVNYLNFLSWLISERNYGFMNDIYFNCLQLREDSIEYLKLYNEHLKCVSETGLKMWERKLENAKKKRGNVALYEKLLKETRDEYNEASIKVKEYGYSGLDIMELEEKICRLNNDCDIHRYNLIKTIEKLSNCCDQREHKNTFLEKETVSHAKHNPPQE